ncbi:hypothetical protein [Streptomyces mesophilus]|uniref:hypothetical protein n=1 Tax=Streptomyces mesophilus TaxID=1775132 RepID=UPI0033171F59
MPRRAAALTLLLAAAFLPTAPASAESARSLTAAERGVDPGAVCFHTEPGGDGASWCYRPSWGYADVPEPLHNNAASFESDADVTVYAIDWVSPSECHYQSIWPGDLSTNWEWRNKLDAVQSERPTDCQQG